MQCCKPGVANHWPPGSLLNVMLASEMKEDSRSRAALVQRRIVEESTLRTVVGSVVGSMHDIRVTIMSEYTLTESQRVKDSTAGFRFPHRRRCCCGPGAPVG